MMVKFSGVNKSPQEIWTYYHVFQSALQKLRDAVQSGALTPDDAVYGMTDEEYQIMFDEMEDEIDHWVVLNLIASAEANIKVDYLTRVKNRKRDSLSRHYRALYQSKKLRVRLYEDLLALWRDEDASSKIALDQFAEILKIRHWIAHGRYWILKSKYHPPLTIKKRVDDLLTSPLLLG